MIKKYAYLLPLIILVAMCIAAIYKVTSTDYIFDNRQYLGLTFVAISLIATLIRRTWGVYLTGITLFLGTFTLIAFTVAIETYSFGFSEGASIKIQPIPLLLLLLYLALSYRTLLALIRGESKK